MSIIRAKHRQANQSVLLQNRLTTFTNPPMRIGDLYIEKNETIGGNLTVGRELRSSSFYATGNYYLDDYVLIPAGTVIQSAAINEPAGWFECDGRVLNRQIYTDLFDAIGYTYSSLYGNDDLSFNIPDTRGRVTVGLGNGAGLTARNLGDKGGEARNS